MPAGPSTLADLREAGVINSREIVAAIDVYMRDPVAGSYRFASGHSLDIAAIVDATPNLDRGAGQTHERRRGSVLGVLV